MMADLELRILFRDSAWCWRLDPNDAIELWRGPERLGSLPGALLLDILRDYLNKVALLAHVQATLAASAPAPQGPDRVEGARQRPARRGPDRAERTRRRFARLSRRTR